MIDIVTLVLLSLVTALTFVSYLFVRRRLADATIDSSAVEEGREKTERLIREEMALNRKEAGETSKEIRNELSSSVGDLSNSLLTRFSEFSGLQQSQLDTFSKTLGTLIQSIEEKLDTVRDKVETKLESIQKDNTDKLEQMRVTVDEKLHESLEKRLGESFKLVSERLEQVHQGLGEMQNLATGVGDLKKALTNVRTRGALGEVQLESILEQMLAPSQYAKNASVKEGSQERVEFVINLPGIETGGDPVLLPIDAKFPLEDYERLIDAYEQADKATISQASKQLESRVKSEAKAISGKYINPPTTTSHAIMFVPTEGLFAEILRIPGLSDKIQRDHNVHIAGPTTIAAIVLGFQVGFRTLAIQEHSEQVWKVLGAVKTEFGKFGDMLDKTHKKLLQASKGMDDATRKTRTIERKLRDVEQLPPSKAAALIGNSLVDNDSIDE